MTQTPLDSEAQRAPSTDQGLSSLERSGVVPFESLDALARLESEAWERLAARDQGLAARAGHPLAPAVLEWRHMALRAAGDLAESAGGPGRREPEGQGAGGLEPAIEPLDQLAEDLLAEDADPALAAAREGDCEGLFQALMAIARSGREALLARRRDLGPTPHGEEESRLRRELRAAMEARPPGEAAREAWTADLVDLADETLAASLGKPAKQAVSVLEHVRAVLLHHVAAVEPTKSTRSRRLKRKLGRLRDEAVERRLEGKLDARFGRRLTRIWARVVLGSILLLLLLMLQGLLPDAVLDARPFGARFTIKTALSVLDFACCLLILWDFVVRLVFVRGDWTWLRRHVFTDFLPSIPAGLPGVGEGVRTLYIFRLGRLMRPLRALTFLSRGLDRLVRLNAERLDQELVLFPTPMERGLDESLEASRSAEHEAWSEITNLSEAWERSLRASPDEQVGSVVARRSAVLQEAARLRFEVGDTLATRRNRGYVLEPRLRRLAEVRSGELGSVLGQESAERIARAARQLANSPARWIPLLRAWTPRPAPEEEDLDLAARWLRDLARRGLRWHGRVLAMADVATTVSPAEFVGRVGATLVARTSRPAYRLLLFGLALVVLQGVLSLVGWEALKDFYDKLLKAFVGTVFLTLGAVCFVLLGLGMWLQRLARDASLLYSQIAGAQFAHLTDAIRIRRLERDTELLEKRVLRPERELEAMESPEQQVADRCGLEEAIKGWLLAGKHPACESQGFDPVPPLVLLYRDQLDAAPFTDADARSGARLLGNLALRRLCRRSEAIGRGQMAVLQRGDLARRQGLLGGGYAWFQLMTQAMSQGAARLVVEYNRSALPAQDLARATDAERERHSVWLQARAESRELETSEGKDAPRELTTAFTMLHILDDDPARDGEVEKRFGPRLAEQLARDRRNLFVRVFGSWPLHHLPKEQRVLNPREFHERWLAHGRIFLTPLWLLGIWLRIAWAGLRFLGRAVAEIRDPARSKAIVAPESNPAAAARKLYRLRGPMAEAAMDLRSRLDPEYLGVGFPGQVAPAFDAAQEDVAALGGLNFPPELAESLDHQRAAARDDVSRLRTLIEIGLLDRLAESLDVAPRDPERLRAVCVAYRADLDGLRARLSFSEILAELRERASEMPAPRGWSPPRPGLYLAFRRWWKSVGKGPGSERRHLWRLVRMDLHGARRALQAFDAYQKDSEGERRASDAVLEDLLRHPGQITEPLVTLRTVQSLTRIDATTLSEHVWRLAGFEDHDGRARTS